MAYTSPSGAGTRLHLTLTGEGADPASLPCTTTGVVPTETNTVAVPDTGRTTAETTGASPIIISSIVFFLVSLLVAGFFFKNAKRRLLFAKNFRFSAPRLTLKQFGLFAGIFAASFLIAGTIVPNFISPDDNASALDANSAIAITTGSSSTGNTLSMSAALSGTASMAVASETITINSATTNGYTLYLSTDNDLESALYRDGEACAGYIAPTAGTTGNRTALEVNHWGFAVDISTSVAFQNLASWAAVPKYGSEAVVKQTTAATSAGETVKVVYGALVNNSVPAGDYYNTVIYTAIANLAQTPTVQTTSAPAPQTTSTPAPMMMSAAPATEDPEEETTETETLVVLPQEVTAEE